MLHAALQQPDKRGWLPFVQPPPLVLTGTEVGEVAAAVAGRLESGVAAAASPASEAAVEGDAAGSGSVGAAVATAAAAAAAAGSESLGGAKGSSGLAGVKQPGGHSAVLPLEQMCQVWPIG